MEYRTLGRTGFSVSAIALGTEYLINQPRENVVGVIHEAIRLGINYFDLFFANPVFRDHMGEAFAGRRESVMLAAHLGSAEVNGQYCRTSDVPVSERYFQDFLARFRTDYVDVLFLHDIDLPSDYDAVMAPGGLRDVALRLSAAGQARAIGFSGHTVATCRQAVETGDVDVLMFPINLAGETMAGREELLRNCVERGVGVVAMKPFAGGRLLRPEHILVKDGWLECRGAMTPAQCLDYVLRQTGVATTVPGCQNLPELAAADAYWQAAPAEKDYAPILSAFAQYRKGECVYCNHCLPCPVQIDIGKTIYELEAALGQPRGQLLPRKMASKPASECVECGSCDERCPFEVGPMAKVRQAAALLG